jgi:two-component system, NarL family, sensor histidine kinase DegS
MKLIKGKGESMDEGFWSGLQDELRGELETARKELVEINLMLEQSQLEVAKLTQRNASITAHLQQVQAQFDTMPRPDIRMAYDSALDAQQRLFVMRGQLDKLGSDRGHLDRHIAVLDKLVTALESGPPQSGGRGSSSAAETVEMVIQAQEAERQRLARQMHDEPAQALSNFILQAEIAMRLFDVDQNKAREELSNLKLAATSTFQKVRGFIFELRPMMLDDLGLAPTLTRYVEAFKESSGLEVRLNLGGLETRLEPYREVMVFRAVQELLHNVQKHSGAGQVTVQVDAFQDEVRVSVSDNGKGFVFEDGLERGRGLKLIRERVEMLGGGLEAVTTPGQGAQLSFHIPAVKSAVFA